MSDFDTMLRRPLRSGNEYDALFPVTSCKSTYVGDGDTDFSIDEMEKVIEQYAFQTEKVAKKLQKTSLKATTDNIHDFLFNHFQYLADESNQLLRSPACSWFTRKNGIDCKSYTILGMSLCLNLNLIAYIRKIKQPGYAPDEYTHVYVIVPIDQETGSLESGYYVIDGTLKNNIEPAFIGKNDTRMDGLKHYALNGASSQRKRPLNGSVSINTLKDLSKNISFKDLNIFKSLGCMGWNGKEKSAVSPEQYQANLTKIDEYYANWQVRLNTAIQNKNNIDVSKLVAEFQANTPMFIGAVGRKISEKWNACSTARMEGVLKHFLFYQHIVGKLITTYVDEYFTKVSGSQTFNATSAVSKSQYGFDFQDFSTPSINTVSFPNVTPKNIDIPAFQVPKAIIEKVNVGGSLNLNSFLELIEKGAVLAAGFSGSGSGFDGSGYAIDGSGQFQGGNIKDFDTKKTNTAGGLLFGLLIVGAGFYALKNIKNTKNTKNTKK